jgi:hypothetical protein
MSRAARHIRKAESDRRTTERYLADAAGCAAGTRWDLLVICPTRDSITADRTAMARSDAPA